MIIMGKQHADEERKQQLAPLCFPIIRVEEEIISPFFLYVDYITLFRKTYNREREKVLRK